MLTPAEHLILKVYDDERSNYATLVQLDEAVATRCGVPTERVLEVVKKGIKLDR